MRLREALIATGWHAMRGDFLRFVESAAAPLAGEMTCCWLPVQVDAVDRFAAQLPPRRIVVVASQTKPSLSYGMDGRSRAIGSELIHTNDNDEWVN